MVGMIRSWQGDPELDPLYRRVQASKTRRGFLDCFAETLVAGHAKQAGCRVAVEVPTPNGRTVDLHVQKESKSLFVHIKRLGGTQTTSRRLTISSRLRILEKINRPLVVKIRWHDGLDDSSMQAFVLAAGQFIERASLGDEHVVKDAQGTELGGVKIVAPNDEGRVSLVIGLPEGFVDHTSRIVRLIKRAQKQFMPKEANLVLVCTPQSTGVESVKSAFFGTHEERWDAHPPKGSRVAVGRSDDGVWSGNQHPESQLGGWFWLAPMHHQYQGKFWVREGCSFGGDLIDFASDMFDT
jgi:hypothetical protein